MNALAMTHNPDIHLSFGRVTRSEWVKQFTLRSTYWVLGLTAAIWVGTTLLVLSQSSIGAEQSEFYGQAPIGVYQFALFVLPICGVMAVTNEYASGMIRSTLAAVPRRLPVLAGKALVITVVTAAVTAAAIAVNMVLSMAFGGSVATDAVLGSEWLGRYGLTILGLVATTLIGLGIGFLLRNTAGAVGATLGLYFLGPMLFSFTESIPWLYDLRRFLPTSALDCMLGVSYDSLLTQVQGALVLAAWVIVALGAAAAVLRRRDV